MSTSSTAARGLRRDIQGLRAVAVLVVVAEHVLLVPSGGFVGVDVFFVVSGFLITGILMRAQLSAGRISFADFYRRRIRRILPAALVTLAATALAAQLVFNSARAASTMWDAVWAALFGANWRFALQGTDYFAAEGPVSPIQHFWSLSVEEQFYFVWPVLLFAVAALAGSRRGWGESQQSRFRWYAAATIAVVSAGSLAWAFWETQHAPGIAYFSTFSRAWELGVGALLAILLVRGAKMPAPLRTLASWAGLALITFSVVYIDDSMPFPAPWALLPVVGSALVLFAGAGAEPRHAWLLTNPVAVYVGDISYSLYLWHFPALVVGGSAIAALFGLEGLWLAGAVLALSLVLAVLSYHFIEQPVRRSRWLMGERGGPPSRLAPRHLVVATAAACTVAVLTGAVMVDRSASSVTSAQDQDQQLIIDGGADEGDGTPAQDALSAQIASALEATDWPADLHPAIESVGQEELPGETARCGGPILPEDPATCTFGDPDAPKTAILVGDSIAQMYVPALAELFGTGEWKLRITSMYACPFVDLALGDSEERSALCSTRRETAVSIIDQTTPDLLIIANTYVRNVDGATGAKAALDAWDAGFRRSLEQVEGKAGGVVVLPPPPADVDIQECLTPMSTPADCVSRISSTDWADMANLQRAAIDDADGVFLDNRAWYCDSSSQCPAFVGSVLRMKDQAHATADYIRFITPVIGEALAAAGLPASEPSP